MRTLLAAVLTVALVACNADNITAVSEPVMPVSTDVWAGGTVEIHSHAFTSPDSLPLVLLAGDTLPASLTDTFVMCVELPDTVSGPLSLSVLNAAASDTQTVAVYAHGFVREYPGTELTGALPQRSLDGYVLALDTLGTVMVNPEAGTAQPLLPPSPGQTPCTDTPTPGLSLVPNVVLGAVGRGSGCKYYAWSFASGAPAVIDSGPYGDAFAVAYLGPHSWIVNPKHATYALTDTSDTRLGLLEEPAEFVTDAAGRFLVSILSSIGDTAGIPIFSTATSGIAHRISGQREIGGAGFSRDGDTLFVAGVHEVTTGGPIRLLALDAVTGQILMQGPLDAYGGAGGGYMVVEPNRPWIYLQSYGRIPINGTTRATMGVEVIDRRTLTLIAHMEVPPSAPQVIKFDDVIYAAPGTHHTLYLIDINGWRSGAGATRVYEFDLLP